MRAKLTLPSRSRATGARRPTIEPLAVTGTAIVAALSTTPVKGLRIQRREAIELELGGVADDRCFYLIDERSKMVNGKVLGALSEVVASYDLDAGALLVALPRRHRRCRSGGALASRWTHVSSRVTTALGSSAERSPPPSPSTPAARYGSSTAIR